MNDEDVAPDVTPDLRREVSVQSSVGSYEYDEDDDDEMEEEEEEEEVQNSQSHSTPPKTSNCDEILYEVAQLDKLTQDINELNLFYSSKVSTEKNKEACDSPPDDNEGIRCWHVNSVTVWIVLSPERFLLNEETSFAWGLDKHLAIKLVFGSHGFEDKHVLPKVSRVGLIDRGDIKEVHDLNLSQCGLEWFIKERLGLFIRDTWLVDDMLDRRLVHEIMECTGTSTEVAQEALKKCKDRNEAINLILEKGEAFTMQIEFWKEFSHSLPPSYFTHYQKVHPMLKDNLLSLHEMFPDMSSGDLFQAMLLSDFNIDVAATRITEMKPQTKKAGFFSYFGEGGKSSDKEVNQVGKGDKLARAREWRSQEFLAMSQMNYFTNIVHFVEDKVRTVNERCLVCDGKLSVVGIKPQVCSGELCAFKYEELGLGLELGSQILRSPQLIELLIGFFVAAVEGRFRVGLFFPYNVKRQQKDGTVRSFIYPEGVSAAETETSNSSYGNPHHTGMFRGSATVELDVNEFPMHRINFKLLTDVINLIPSLEVLKLWAAGKLENTDEGSENSKKKTKTQIESSSIGDGQEVTSKGVLKFTEYAEGDLLRVKLDELDDLIYPLLQWLVSSNLSHIRILKEEERFQQMTSHNNFVLLSGPAEREQTFQKLKQTYGSFFAWHGSSISNWHVILRTSLKNMSDTKFMSAGKAKGSGIYFAANAQTSLMYSQKAAQKTNSTSWFRRSKMNPTFCIALCEIIDNKEEFTHAKDGIFVVPQEHYVVTRFLLVNPSFSHKFLDATAFVEESRKRGDLKFL